MPLRGHRRKLYIMLDLESIPVIISILGGVGTFLSILWVKVINPIIKFINHQDDIKLKIDDIKKELSTNGGNSLKDSILDLRKVCHRIEIRQKIIEQRTKAALHYSSLPLFETDNEGRLIWSNSLFYQFADSVDVEGYDWLNLIIEEDRDDLLEEFKSCLNTNRKFAKETLTHNNKPIVLTGFPYRISDSEQGGYLVSISVKGDLT
jgi:hypothetical protein